MTSKRPFRFGLFCGQGAGSRQAWADKARAVEAAGFSTLPLGDHLPFSLSPIAGLMAAANATTTLRVGTAVFGNDFRHPVFLAREAATLDRLSDGRFEFGLGTGWYHVDYEQSGIPLDAPGIRVDRLEEAVKVIKGFFGEQPFDSVSYTHLARAHTFGAQCCECGMAPIALLRGRSHGVNVHGNSQRDAWVAFGQCQEGATHVPHAGAHPAKLLRDGEGGNPRCPDALSFFAREPALAVVGLGRLAKLRRQRSARCDGRFDSFSTHGD